MPTHIFKTTSLLIIISAIVILSLVEGCSPTESVFEDHEIVLSVDAEVIESWITLSANPVKTNFKYTVMRDTSIMFEGRLTQNDTLLHDEKLEPATTYSYKAFAQKSNEKSKTVTTMVTTMDTTSHDFTIEKFEWGEKGSSDFLDVAIINSNDAWAVGEIFLEDSYTYDSLGNWIEPYNAAHWDGNEWELIRVPVLATGSNDKSHEQLNTVFALNENEVIFSNGGILIFYDGTDYTYDTSFNSRLTGGIKKIWASSKDNIFIVGTSGMIGHCNGQSWQFLDSGTEMWVMDILGVYNENKDQYDIYCPVTLPLQDGQPDLLRIKSDLTISSQKWPNGDIALYSVWFKDLDKMFLAGGGLFTYNAQKRTYSYSFPEIPKIILNRVRGNEENDLFIAGHFGILKHFNGITWKEFTYFHEIDHFWSLDMKDDLTIAVGDNDIKATIYNLKRK